MPLQSFVFVCNLSALLIKARIFLSICLSITQMIVALRALLQGIAVHDGGSLEATTVVIEQTAVTAIEAMGKHSKLLLKSCTIQNLLEGAPKSFRKVRELTDIRGVFVHHEASAELHDVTVFDCQWGVFTCDGAETALHRCRVHDTENACVSFRSGGSGSAFECEFSVSKKAHGLEVSCRSPDSGTCADLLKCKMFGNRQAGAAVFGPGRLTLSRCEAHNNRAAGFWAHDNACMELKQCSSDEDKVGFGASSKAKIEAEQCRVECSSAESFLLKGGSQAKLSDCSSAECQSTAVYVSGKDSKAELTGCSVERCSMNAIHVDASATCTLEMCTIKTALNGVRVEQATLIATGLTVSHSSGCGVVLQGGEIDMHECCIEQCGAAGLVAAKMLAKVSMSKCKVHQTAHACVSLQDGSTGLLTESQFGDSRESSGVEVMGVCTSATVKGCRMYGNARCGITVVDCAVLKADHCLTVGNKCRGFEGLRKAEVTLESIESTDDGAGCVMRACSANICGMRVLESLSVGFEFSCAASVRLERSFAILGVLSGIRVTGSETNVKMIGCEVRDNGEFGVVVCSRARADANRLVSTGHEDNCGFRCKDRGSVLNLVGCKSFDDVAYQCDMLCVLRCEDCTPAKQKGASVVRVLKEGLGLGRVRGGDTSGGQ